MILWKRCSSGSRAMLQTARNTYAQTLGKATQSGQQDVLVLEH